MKDMGLVSQVFDEPQAVGPRRATWRSATPATRPPARRVWQNAQPVVRHAGGRTVALGHNGNLTNTAELREELRARAGVDCARRPTPR